MDIHSALFIPTLDTSTEFAIILIWQARNLRSRSDNSPEIIQEFCIAFNISMNKYFGYLLESKTNTMFCGEKIKQDLYYILFAAFKDYLQQQIHFDDNIFGNKCCSEFPPYIILLPNVPFLLRSETSALLSICKKPRIITLKFGINRSYLEPVTVYRNSR